MKSREQILAPGATEATIASADLSVRSVISLDVYVGQNSWVWKVCLNKATLKKCGGYETHAHASQDGMVEWTRIVAAISDINSRAVSASMTLAGEGAK